MYKMRKRSCIITCIFEKPNSNDRYKLEEFWFQSFVGLFQDGLSGFLSREGLSQESVILIV